MRKWLPDATLEHLRRVADRPDLGDDRYEVADEIGRGGMGAVYRVRDAEGSFKRDVLALRDEPAQGGKPLLTEVMRDGRRMGPYPSLEEVRARVREELAHLPDAYKALHGAPAYPVEVSEGLRDLALEVTEEIEAASRTELGQR